jgi:hypothetical protein
MQLSSAALWLVVAKQTRHFQKGEMMLEMSAFVCRVAFDLFGCRLVIALIELKLEIPGIN